MIVKELTALLRALPDQDAEVLVVKQRAARGSYDQSSVPMLFNPGLDMHYTDFRGNTSVPASASYFNWRTLLAGTVD